VQILVDAVLKRVNISVAGRRKYPIAANVINKLSKKTLIVVQTQAAQKHPVVPRL